MFNGAVAVAVHDFNAEAVVGTLAVFEFDLGEHLFVALGFEDGLRDETFVPESQVVRGHGQLTRGEHPSAPFLGCHTQRAEGVANVGCGVGGGQLGFVGVPNRLHAERAEDTRGEQVHERCAGDGLHNAAGDDEVGIGILPLRAGLEVERLFGPGIDNLLGALWFPHGGHQVVFGPVVLVAGSVRENLADGDFVALGEAGNVLANRVVERELALFLKQQNGSRGELLGDGANGIAHLRRGRGSRVETGQTVGVGVGKLAMLDDRN